MAKKPFQEKDFTPEFEAKLLQKVKEHFPDPICPECGATLVFSDGPGRRMRYRGEDGYEVPEGLGYRECPQCGAQWLTASQIKQLSEAFEAQRRERHPPLLKRLVILETPFAALSYEDIAKNLDYTRRCARHCLDVGDAPFASHLIYTQALDDTIPSLRTLGIEAGLLWGSQASASVVYTDLGITPGMEKGMARAIKEGREVEERTLPEEYWKITLPVFPGSPRLCKDCAYLQPGNECPVLGGSELHDALDVVSYVENPFSASPEGVPVVSVTVNPDEMGCLCFKSR